MRVTGLPLLAVATAAGASVAPLSAETAGAPALLTYVAQARIQAATPSAVCLARADGSRRVRLIRASRPRLGLSRPSWSPNGKHFVYNRGAALTVADARGRVVRTLIRNVEYPPPDPVWSPDGRRIAVMGGGRGGALGVIPARGGRWRELARSRTLATGFESPTWMPDSRRLAFSIGSWSVPPGLDYPSGIYTVGLDGTDLRLVIPDAERPAYSPDGTRLAYVLRGDVYVSRADGRDARRVTGTPAEEDRPAWSPDGRRLAFSRLLGDRSVIVVARADGSSARVVVSSRKYDATFPSWRPAVPLQAVRRVACP